MNLPLAAGHVVQAVSVNFLSAGLKDVWHVLHRFDRSADGCYLTASQLAEKIGMTEGTVETYRRELLGLGLVTRGARGWHVTLPADCIPRVARPGPAEVIERARRLEQALTRTPVRVGPERARTPVRVEPEPRFGSVTPSDPNPRSGVPAQSRPKSPEPPFGSVATTPTAVGVKAVGEKTPTAVGVATRTPVRIEPASPFPTAGGAEAGGVGAYAPQPDHVSAMRCDCGQPLLISPGGRLRPCAHGPREADPDVVARAAMRPGA